MSLLLCQNSVLERYVYRPGLAEIPAPDGPQDVMSQMRNYPLRKNRLQDGYQSTFMGKGLCVYPAAEPSVRDLALFTLFMSLVTNVFNTDDII